MNACPAGVRCLLGVITQVEEGQYYLEDLTGREVARSPRRARTASLKIDGGNKPS